MGRTDGRRGGTGGRDHVHDLCPVTVTDTHGGSTRILTVNQTEATVLAQAGVAPLGENDRIVTSETPDGELMQVLRAYTVPVTADGQTQEIITTGATTRDLLTQAGLTYTEEDYLTPAVPEGSSVTLQRVSYVEYTEDETVPSEVEEIPTSLYYRKQDKVQVVQQGTDGLDTVTYRETWVDGQQVDTEEIGRETQIGMIPTIQKVYGEQASVSSFVGPEVEDGVPVEGVAAVYTSQHHSVWFPDVHHQRRWKIRLWLCLRCGYRRGYDDRPCVHRSVL